MPATMARNRGVTRRSAVAVAAGFVVGTSVSQTVARDMGRQARPKEPFVRAVAIDAIGSSSNSFLTIPESLTWVTSAVGSPDLVILGVGEGETGTSEMELAQRWAERNSCYVTLAGHENVLIGPYGRLEARSIVSGLQLFSTEIGAIAMLSLNAMSITQLDQKNVEVDVFVFPAVAHVSQNNAYVIGLSSQHRDLVAGPIIYGPGGHVLTRAAADRVQGVTAMLNVASLRPAKISKKSQSAFLEEGLEG